MQRLTITIDDDGTPQFDTDNFPGDPVWVLAIGGNGEAVSMFAEERDFQWALDKLMSVASVLARQAGHIDEDFE